MTPDISRYYMTYDALHDVFEPISRSEAYNAVSRQQALPMPRQDRPTAHDLGYDLRDGDVLIAVKLGYLEQFLAERRGEVIKSQTPKP
jgi:hypothetical protein